MFEFLFGKAKRTTKRKTYKRRGTKRTTKRRGTKRTYKRRGTKQTYKRRGTKRTYKRKTYKRRGTKRTYKRRAKSVINNSKVLLQINNSAQHVIDNITSAGGSPKEVAEAVAATVADIAELNGAPAEEVVHIAQKMAVDSAITAGASPEAAAKAAEDAGHSALAVIGNDYPPIPVVNMMYLMLLIAKEMEAKDAMPAEIGVVQDAVQQSVGSDGSVSVPEVVDAANKAVPGQQWGYNILNAVVDTAESMISGVVPKKKYGPETKPQTWGYDLLNNVKNYGVDKTKNISAKAGKSIYDISKAMGSTQNAGEGEPLMLFGRRRNRFCGKCNQNHFGSKCSRMPNNEMCTNYMTPGGSYPCFSTEQGCRRRWDKTSRHQSYTKQTSKSSIVRNIMGGNVSSFGKKRKLVKRSIKKLPKAFVKRCRKYGIKTTKKVGSKRVQKRMSVLKKQLKKAMRRSKR